MKKGLILLSFALVVNGNHIYIEFSLIRKKIFLTIRNKSRIQYGTSVNHESLLLKDCQGAGITSEIVLLKHLD